MMCDPDSPAYSDPEAITRDLFMVLEEVADRLDECARSGNFSEHGKWIGKATWLLDKMKTCVPQDILDQHREERRRVMVRLASQSMLADVQGRA